MMKHGRMAPRLFAALTSPLAMLAPLAGLTASLGGALSAQGGGVQFAERVIPTSASGPSSVFAIDMDGDGDTDVLSASQFNNQIAWYQNDGGSPPSFAERVIPTSASGASPVFAIDMDGDGDTDVLSASQFNNQIAWYQNDGGSPPSFTERVLSTTAGGAISVFATDVDGDGDIDVLSALESDNEIVWYESDGGAPPSFTERVILTAALFAQSVFAADVDGDGNIDVLSASLLDDKIAWHRSDGGSPPNFTERVISVTADQARSVFATDVDSDGDIDVLSASSLDDKIAWYENDGGSPPTFTERVISITADQARSVFATDVDGDGDTDVLSASSFDDKIAWYENDGGSPPTFTERIISTTADAALSVFAADVDGDGDIDVLSASFFDNKIAWYENTSTICGDGLVEGVEECDDGATTDGDGCSALCVVEDAYVCTGMPSICTLDCNGNGIPDNSETDCNGNGIPDDCETFTDCNTNGILDSCDITTGTSQDCTANGVPDECEPDCNANTVADSCDILAGTSPDCNANSIPDGCELDTDGDGAIDDCDNCALPNPAQEDCNNNGIGDVCEMTLMQEETFSGGMFNSAPNVTWTNPSTGLGWFFTSSSFSLPGDVIQSIDIANGGTTAMNAEFDFGSAGGSVSFDWAVDSELCCGGLFFSIDGSIQLERRGFLSGSSTFQLGPGLHRFEWRYSKSIPFWAGADAGAIDNVLFTALFDLTQDCNDNGVLDECDVDPGDPDGNGLVSPDCNANGIPDECDLVSPMDFVHQSAVFSPFQSLANASEVIPMPPIAVGDVTLTVEVKADLDQVNEFVDVLLNGIPVGNLFESDAAQCPATFDTSSLIIVKDTFNALLPGDVAVELVPSAAVDVCAGVVKMRLSYTAESNNDCNGNGVPDECDTDTDLDGVIDDCDPCPLDYPDDTDGDGVCDSNDLCSDTPLGLLVDLDGCTLAQGPCCFGLTVCIDGTDRQTCEAFPDGFFQGKGLTCGDPDGDGISGCLDGCPLDPNKTYPGVCGCGVADEDGDLDGVPDCNDLCPQSPSDVPANVCGCTEVGACCASDGGCFDNIERTLCVIIAGFYQGDGSTCAENCGLGDLDGDGDVDLSDFARFGSCFTGPSGEGSPACSGVDVDGCGPIDLKDFSVFHTALTGP